MTRRVCTQQTNDDDNGKNAHTNPIVGSIQSLSDYRRNPCAQQYDEGGHLEDGALECAIYFYFFYVKLFVHTYSNGNLRTANAFFLFIIFLFSFLLFLFW